MSFQYTSSTSWVTSDASVPLMLPLLVPLFVPLLVLTPDCVAISDSPGSMVAVQVLLLPLPGKLPVGVMLMSVASLQAASRAAAKSSAVA